MSNSKFPDDLSSISFYNACSMVSHSILPEIEAECPIFRLEDLGSKTSAVNDLVSHITDGMAELGEDVVRSMQETVVGRRSKRRRSVDATYGSWDPIHKEAYRLLVSKDALKAYQRLGYEFPHPVL